MNNKVLITDKIKDRLWDDLQLCLMSDMETIISKYNNNVELTKNEIFILGYNLSLVRKNKQDELSEFRYTSDRLFLDELETLVTDMLNEEKTKIVYFDVHVFEDGVKGYSVPVKMEVKTNKELTHYDVVNYLVDNNLLDKDEKRFIDDVKEIDENEYQQMIDTILNIKNNIMKRIYVKIQIKIQNGDYQYFQFSTHVLEVPENTTPKKTKFIIREYGENHARTYYGNFSHEDESLRGKTYYFNGGEVATELYTDEEISESDYNILSKHLI